VLVNNAGYGHTTPFEQMTTQDFRYRVETNLFGGVNLTRAVLPVMREQHAGHLQCLFRLEQVVQQASDLAHY
jgi:NAD(P)-dependent dehydrogenase (short-subunit alcohol dehydrogenase family)